MDSDDSESAPMDLDLDASDNKDLGLDGHPATTPPAPLDFDVRKTSDKSTDHKSLTNPGEKTDHAISSTPQDLDASKSSDNPTHYKQKTPGEKKEKNSPYDKAMIRQVFECRNCDFKSENLSAVSGHVELHKRPGPSKPVWWPKYGVVDVPKEAAPSSLALPKHAEKWLSECNSAADYPFKFKSESKVACQICEHEFVVKQKCHLTNHIKTNRHRDHVPLKEDKKEMEEQGTSELAKDLCKMACAANLAWNVFNNPIVRETLQKHMGKQVPCGKTIAGRLDGCYKEVMEEIKKDLDGHPFWLETDETNGMNSYAWI